MFKRVKKKYKSSIALLLSLTLILPALQPITMQAGTSNTNPGGNPNGVVGGKGLIQAPGIMVGVTKIKNTHKGKITSEDGDKNGNHELELSVYDYYYNKFPSSHIHTPDSATKYMLIGRDSNGSIKFKDRTNWFVFDGAKGGTKFEAVYDVVRGSSSSRMNANIVKDANEKKTDEWKKWEDYKFTFADAKKLFLQDKKSLLATTKGQFLDMFKNLDSIGANFNSMFGSAKKADNKSAFAYLELLMLLYSMSSKAGKSAMQPLIEQFITDRNADDSKEFIIVEMIAIQSLRKDGDYKNMFWYTYPAYMKMCTNGSLSKFSGSPGNHSNAYSKSNSGAFIAKDKEWEAKQYSRVTDTTNFNNRGSTWYFRTSDGTGWGNRYTVMPRNLEGKMKGNASYTIFTRYGVKDSPNNPPDGQIKLSAKPKTKVVGNGDNVSADIVISLEAEEKVMKDFLKYYDDVKKKTGKTPTLTLTLQFKSIKGDGKSPNSYDSMSEPGFAKLSGDTITAKNISRENLKDLLTAKKKFRLVDSGITITKQTVNHYIVAATLDWPEGKPSRFASRGAGKPKEKYENKTGVEKAWDEASWSTSPVPPEEDQPVTEGHFYSQMGPHYVEIKEGSPGSETFEAMAGVPTTEDLYVGFGASEFMMNMDVEQKESEGTREYDLTYTSTKCAEVDTPCTYTCPGHTITAPGGHVTGTTADGTPILCSAGSASGSCSSGPVDLTAACSCGATTVNKTFTPKWGSGYSECKGGDGSKDYTGMGCVHNKQINTTHPHTHIFTGKVTQPIGTFVYTDIKAMELWQVNRLTLAGSPELFSNPNQVIDPRTGYRTFFNQEGYKNGNGRLVFSFNYSQNQRCGNTSTAKSDAKLQLKADCDKDATDWMNSQVEGKETNAKVISDYAVLTTTEGYQSAMYHEYESDTVPITTETFSTGSDNKAIGGEEITFVKQPAFTEMWTSNPNTAAKWEPTHITRSGYNGNFAAPAVKWNNTNVVQMTDPSKYLGSHPNSKNKQGIETFAAPNFGNTRMTKTGLNVIDSTDADRNWSADDGIEPIYNGAYDTGKCTMEADKEISFNETEEGFDYATEDNGMYQSEVGYSERHSEVNDIVIHNPVANTLATIITNDSKYDLRTETSLAEGGDPELEQEGCPEDASCPFSQLTCKIAPSLHTDACYTTIDVGKVHIGGMNTHVHDNDCGVPDTTGWMHIHCVSGCRNPLGACTGNRDTCQNCKNNVPFENNTYPNDAVNTGGNGWYVTHESGCSYAGQTHFTTSATTCTQCGHSCESSRVPATTCSNAPNAHVCTPACKGTTEKVTICGDPHHYLPGQPWDYNDLKNHYDFGDTRCYTPCGDDSKHHNTGPVVLPNGKTQAGDIFINLDREFKLYYPDKGDFAQAPAMHGIGEVTSIRGMGYSDNMNTGKWVRDKYAVFPVNVIDEKGIPHDAGTTIDLLELPDVNNVYTFYAVLANDEQVNGLVSYVSIGNNAAEAEYYTDNELTTNRDREGNYTAKHTAFKSQVTDVVGYIGALTMNDTGDFRFATLFKQVDNDNPGWLIENLVPRVNYKLPNKIVADNIDVRQETASEDTNWHSPYSVTEAVTGGKAHPYVSLPLVPYKNPIESLQKQPLRPGYQMYMDIETAGNYYGETEDINGNYVDTDLYYKMQITPRYWELDLESGRYQPVDVYMGSNGEYTPVVLFGNSNEASEWIYYLDWMEESARRNYTSKEKVATTKVADELTFKVPSYTVDGETIPEVNRRLRVPILQSEPIGTANRLFLNDLNRTFIGSSTTYKKDKNPDEDGNINNAKEKGVWEEWYFNRQSQRWQFTLGLPSSSVFVPAGKPCTDANIKSIQDKNSVIVCAIDIKVQGTVWALEYDGTDINYSDGGGIKVTPNGDIYPPPTDPDTGRPIDDPIIAVYSNKFTSKNDLRTEGSH